MSNEPTFGPPTADEIAPMNVVLEQALTFQLGTMASFIEAIGHEHARVVRRNGRVVSGLSVIPFAHWFGGRPVTAAGVTAVGVSPDQRGSGIGLFMLTQMLREQRAAGVPIATLYPATTNFYRRSGFERAAHRIIYEMPLAAIGVRDYTLEAEPVEPGAYAVLKDVYAQAAARSASFIERPDFYWQRLFESKEKPTYKFVAKRNGVPEGYVIFSHVSWGEPLSVRDIIALTPAAGRRLLTLLGDHRSIVETVRFPGGSHDPLLFLMPEQRQTVQKSLDLMLRILDVPAAFAARGYAPGVEAELHFEISDDVLPENTGRFVLQVADRRGRAEAGGQGRIKLHIRDLAALYSGYYTPFELRQAAPIQADEADLAVAAQVFSGPRPWLPDMF